MADVEKVARAICRADRQDPDRLIHYRDIQVSSTREPYPAWRNYIRQAEAALAAMGEREAVQPLTLNDPSDDEAARWVMAKLHGIRRDSGTIEYTLAAVIRAYQAGKASVASPRPEAVEEIAAIAESLRQAYPMEASRILILLGKAQPAAIQSSPPQE